ncbi:unnamed protein product, partial [Porites lobata]
MVSGAGHARKHLSSKNGCAPGSNGLFSYGKKNGNYVAESRDEFEETPFHAAVMTYLAYFFYIIFGYFRDFLRKHGLEKCKTVKENGNEGFVPLYSDFESFYTRNMYTRARDCFNRPICSVPGGEIDLLDRESEDWNWTFSYPGTKTRALNLASYNYLGFAENSGPCSEAAEQAVRRYGVAGCSPRNEY